MNPKIRRTGNEQQLESAVWIDRTWCKGCGICVDFCPRKVFTQGEDRLPVLSFADRCTQCGLCELMCPDLAISTRKVRSGATQPAGSPTIGERSPWPEPTRPTTDQSAEYVFMQGNEACVEGALRAGLGFFAGYPITPSTGIAEMLSSRLPPLGGIFIQMEDEMASLAAVIGASMGGLRAMTATSGPGFSLMQENLGYASAAEIPCVIVDVQRAGPSTGQPTWPAQGDVMQSRWGTHGDHPIIVLCPSSVAETFSLTARAFALAERYRTPVILLTDEVVAHMYERVRLQDIQIQVPTLPLPPIGQPYLPYDDAHGEVPPFVSFGRGFRYHVTGLHHDTGGFPTQRVDEVGPLMERLKQKIDGHVEEIAFVEQDTMDDTQVAVVAYGVTARSALHATRVARSAGHKVGFLKLLTLWPFAEKAVNAVAKQVKTVIVPEMNQGQIRLEVERVAGSRADVIGINRVDGALISPEQILEVIRRVC